MKSNLETFARDNKFTGKGPLSVALVITERVKNKTFPLDSNDFLAESGTQVAGLGLASVQAILTRNGISRVLAKEGGRTSRGSVPNMISYIQFLNQMHAENVLDLEIAEKFWIGRVEAFFAGKPFTLRLDPQLGLRAVVRNLMDQASLRQKADTGTMFLGTVMQHLVGAKLDIVLKGESSIEHHNANQNDQKEGRTGDFDIGDVSIHVSTAPSEALIQKCVENLSIGQKPMIITGRKGAVVAEGLAENAHILDRIDIIEFEQFIATNIHELGRFSLEQRRVKVEEIIERYNQIINEVETDPSLMIELAHGR
ncbi:DUF4928 family protein [Undibacterium curvum]|uniref:DUF4928 family protein n=1 Tax=Undibacterium curvum TaxID=2762294 RepID=A0ABR7A702_9BURK|nr:DUF4928 family protein [Undibacterium curvum]MBC3932616.1 DUF4928 family protein [Undibacterium curvum]